MQEQVADFIARYVAETHPLEERLERLILRGEGESPEARELRDGIHVRLMDRDAFIRIRVYAESDEVPDPVIRRQARQLYRTYLKHQREPGLRREIEQAVVAVHDQVDLFRLPSEEVPTGLAEVRGIFIRSSSRDRRRQAWSCLMQLGERIAPLVLEVVSLRNRAARDLGFDDHHQMDLAIRDLDRLEVRPLIEGLFAASERSFGELRRDLARKQARRFRTRQHLLRPWHFRDPYRLMPPQFSELPARRAVSGIRTAAGRLLRWLGLPLPEDALAAALAPEPHRLERPIDNPDAAFSDLRELAGSLRALAQPIFDEHLSPDLPPLLRRPAHHLIVTLLGDILVTALEEPRFLTEGLRLSPQLAGRARLELATRRRKEQLVLARFVPALMDFERELYRDPGQDLTQLWWELMGPALGLHPDDPRAPAWAILPSILEGPGVLCERLVATLAGAQIRRALTRDCRNQTFLARPEAGDFLQGELIAPGAAIDWQELIAKTSGEPLSIDSFLAEIVS